MPFEIATATASFRVNSEDRLAVHHVLGGVVVVVADGAGGIPGGGPAADLVIKIVEDALARPVFNPFASSSWVDLLVKADALVERDRVAGETTCVIVALLDDGRIVGVSVGDSGAVVIARDGTTDDLAADQHRKRRLGSGRASPVTFERPQFSGTLVTASDGLFNYARPMVLGRLVVEHEDLDHAAGALVRAVTLPSGDLIDDVALVLVRAHQRGR